MSFGNEAKDLKSIIAGLHEKRRVAEENAKNGMEIYRLIELSEMSVKTMLSAKKKVFVESFVRTVLSGEFDEILSDYPKFARGLFRTMMFHNIKSYWTNFFNVFDAKIFEVEMLESVVNIIREDRNLVKTRDDYEMVQKLLDVIINDEVQEVTDSMMDNNTKVSEFPSEDLSSVLIY